MGREKYLKGGFLVRKGAYSLIKFVSFSTHKGVGWRRESMGKAVLRKGGKRAKHRSEIRVRKGVWQKFYICTIDVYFTEVV